MKVEKWTDYSLDSFCRLIQKIDRNQETLFFRKQ